MVNVDLARVWQLMDPYLRKLYGEASKLETGDVAIEVCRPDDRDGLVYELNGDWRTRACVALGRCDDGKLRWYDDHFDDVAGEPTYYDKLQDAWDAVSYGASA